jgi:small subunit ribosomal protein S13
MRLLGVELPNKKIEYALPYIYGIGLSKAKRLVEQAGIDPNRRVNDLSEEELNRVAELITFPVEGDLRRGIAANIKRLQAIGCYRGIRHRRGLPVRGQRTHTNARTRKGKRKTVGAMKGKS